MHFDLFEGRWTALQGNSTALFLSRVEGSTVHFWIILEEMSTFD